MNQYKKVRKIVSGILILCMIVSFAAMSLPGSAIEAEAEEKATDSVSDSGFVHPGLLHTSESIEAMKKNVADEVQPTLEAYNALKNEAFSNPAWGGRPAERVERPGNYALLYVDIQRAYQMALLYRLGAGEKYGASAVRILNGWSHTMKTLWGNADRFLAAGIYGYQLANVAELVRDREDFDKEAMDALLLNVFYPLNHEFLLYHNGTSEGRRIRNYWANWDLCNIAGMIAIGVFCDRTDIYEEAVEYYRNGVGMGSFYNAMPYVYDEGLAQWQESGRDQGHSTLGISLCGAINEIAWSQGDDLYGLSDNRFLKAAEYVAKYNNGEDVPYSYYERYNSSNGKVEGNPQVSGASRGSRRPVFTAIYNHYVNRMGLEAPELEKILYPDGTTPFTEGATRGGDDPGWQSLTFHNISTREEGKKAKEMNGDLEDGVYRFWNRNSKKSLVDRDGKLQSTEKGTMDEEWWQVKNTGDGEYIVTNVKTGRVIQTDADAFTSGSSAYTAGTKYVLSEKETGKMNQRLAFLKVTGDYIYRIVSSPCSLVLECSNAGTADDTGLGQWWYEGGFHQQWYVEQKEPSKKRIAGFSFDDEKSGLLGAGAVAAAVGSSSLTFVEDRERGMVLSLSGEEHLNVMKEDGGSLLTGYEEVTVSYYSKSSDTGGGGALFYAAASGDAGSYAAICQQNGKVSLHRGGAGSKSAEAEVSQGWNHIVAVFASGQMKLYVNGSLQADVENLESMEAVLGKDSILQIGKDFNGLLDDFHIYNYAMSESAIKSMEGQQLVAEFTFDDEIDGFVSQNARAENMGALVLSDDTETGKGKSLSLDGSGSNYLRVLNDLGEPLASGWEEMTVSYWSKVTDSGTNWMFYAAPDDEIQILNSEAYLGAHERDGFLNVERYKNTGARISSMSEKAAKDEWKHITVSFGKDRTAVYVNGEKKATLSCRYTVSELLGEESIFYIGRANWGKQGEYCNALLDNLRIYNFALDDTAVEKDYEGYQAAQSSKEDEKDHTADKTAAKSVMAEISAIGGVEYTEECWKKISDARTSYDALTEVQKVWVMNYPALISAEEKYEGLKPIEKKRLAHFTFDDKENGFSYAGTAAVSQSAVKLSDNAVSGKALRLNGADSGNYLKLLDAKGKSILNGCKEVTVSYWGKVYNTNANWGFYAAANDKAMVLNREKYLGVNDTGTKIELNRFYNAGERPQSPSVDAEKGEWRYITAVFSEDKTLLYVNGEMVSEIAGSDSVSKILGKDGVAYLGKANWGDGEYYNGLMDEVSIYNYALSQQEVTTLYEQYNIPDYPVLKKRIANFTFDDEETGFSGDGAMAQAAGTNILTDQAVSNNALRLNGGESGNYLKVTDMQGGSLFGCCEEVTVSYWSKVNNTSANWAFYASANEDSQQVGKERYLGVLDEGTKLTAQRYKNTGERPEDASAAAAKRAWKHITVVYGKTSTSIYVNGELAGSETASSYAVPDILGDNGVIYIGRANWGNGEYFNGWIDEMSIYNYALSQEEVRAVYGEHTPPVETQQCIAEFTFDDEESGFAGSGAKANASGANILSRDAVSGRALSLDGNKNYLTLTNQEGKALFNENEELTVSYWSKVSNTDANWAFYASKSADSQNLGNECYLGILENEGIAAERYHNNGERPAAASAENIQGEWKFVTVVYSLTDTTIYVNGAGGTAEDSVYDIADIVGKDGVAYIGRANWGNVEYYNGLIDEVSIYDYAMGEDEVLELYQSYPIPGTDKEAVEEAETLIAGIGTVTYDEECKAKIDKAKEAYGRLTELQKKILDENISSVLAEAEAEYKRLEQEAEQAGKEDKGDRDAAKAVEQLIHAIGEVKFDAECKAKIVRAREAYEQLSESQKKLIDKETYEKLTGAEETYGELWEAHEKEEREKAEREEREKAKKEQAEKEKAQQGTISVKENQKQILNTNTDSKDVKGSKFAALKLKAAGGTKSVKLSWSRQKRADGYLIYGAPCGKRMKLLKNVSSAKKSYKVTKLKKGKYYKYMVCAYRKIYGEKRIIAKSVTVHACTNGGKYANPSSISYKKSKLVLKRGKTFTFKPKYKSKKKVKTHIAKFRYESSNPKIATVSKKGKVKAKKKGKCYIYLYTQNGIYKRIKVTVK